MSKINLLIILGLLPLSIYPISSNGFQMKRWQVGEINRYYPVSHERIELYRFLNKHTDQNEIIFTPSIYGAVDFSADNFYPAAFSKRIFYLGGYTYGSIKQYKNFKERLEFVDAFSFKKEQFTNLKNKNIKTVLIEYKGNKLGLSENIDKAINSTETKSYKMLFYNSAGIIIELI